METFREWHSKEYGKVPGIFHKAEFVIDFNRAGDNEEELDLEGILDKYCRNSK